MARSPATAGTRETGASREETARSPATAVARDALVEYVSLLNH